MDRALLPEKPDMQAVGTYESDSLVASSTSAAEEESVSKLEHRPPLWRWILAILVPLVALVYVLQKVDRHALGAALAKSNPWLVAVAGLVFLVGCMGASSVRLWLLMRDLPARMPVPLWQMTRVYLASSAAHQLLPAPAAEVLRTLALLRRNGYRLRSLVAVQVLEKLADAVSLGVGLALVWGLAFMPGKITLAIELGAVGGLVALVVLVVWLRARRGIVLPVVLLSILNDGAHALAIGLVLHAVGVPAAPAAAILIVGATRVAGMVPVAPGQLAVTEAAVAWTVGLYGIPVETAIAVALVYRVVRFVPVVLAGLFHWRSLADAA